MGPDFPAFNCFDIEYAIMDTNNHYLCGQKLWCCKFPNLSNCLKKAK